MSFFAFLNPGPRVIGSVLIHGRKTRIDLIGDNAWRVTRAGKRDARMEANLRALYSDRLEDRGPSGGFYGWEVLRDVARQFGGVFRVAKPASAPRRSKY